MINKLSRTTIFLFLILFLRENAFKKRWKGWNVRLTRECYHSIFIWRVRKFSQNRAKVKLDSKYGFIYKDNNKITEIKYTDVNDFSEDMAAVKYIDLQGSWEFGDL